MSFFNPIVNLSNGVATISLTDDSSGNLVISGTNPAMNVNLISTGSFEINGAALPTPADITNLNNEVNQINANLLTASASVFTAPPVQIDIGESEVPPTKRGQLKLASGSYVSFQSPDETTGGGIGIDVSNVLQINSNGGANDVNVVCSNLLVNGNPISGGNPALDECFNVPSQGTFSISAPITISSNSPEQCNLVLNKGSQLVLQSGDGSFNSTINTDNGGNISVNASTFQLPCELTMLNGAQVALYDNTNSTLGTIKNDGNKVVVDGVAELKLPIQLTVSDGNEIKLYNAGDTTYSYINNQNGNLTIENNNGYTFVKGSTAVIAQSDNFEVMGSGLTPNSMIIQPNNGNSEILLDVSGAGVNTIRCVSNFSTTASKSFNVRGGCTYWSPDGLSGSNVYLDNSGIFNLADANSYYISNVTTVNGDINGNYINSNSKRVQVCDGGTTANRPTATAVQFQMYYDTDLDEIIFYQGGGIWKRYNGGVV